MCQQHVCLNDTSSLRLFVPTNQDSTFNGIPYRSNLRYAQVQSKTVLADNIPYSQPDREITDYACYRVLFIYFIIQVVLEVQKENTTIKQKSTHNTNRKI